MDFLHLWEWSWCFFLSSLGLRGPGRVLYIFELDVIVNYYHNLGLGFEFWLMKICWEVAWFGMARSEKINSSQTSFKQKVVDKVEYFISWLLSYKMGPEVCHSMQLFVLKLTENHSPQLQTLRTGWNFVIISKIAYIPHANSIKGNEVYRIIVKIQS